jgi:hypothetical protein
MAKKAGWILFAFALITASVFLIWQSSNAQIKKPDFPETGHVIRGEFYEFFWTAKDPLLVYGYPITDMTTDTATGRRVQYFQRALFELHPEANSEFSVQLAPLGQYLYEPGEPISLPDKFTHCRTFAETGKRICFAFLDFFDANGGVEQFGYPISNFENKFGRIVQYFQRARFEWYPERPTGQRVKLADLGSEHFITVGEDPDKLRRNNILQVVLDLRVRAFPESPVTTLGGQQSIHVLVQDQNLLPVAGAEVELVVRFPSGDEETYTAPITDGDGVSIVTFDVSTRTPGRALVWVNVVFRDLDIHTTRSSFRIWY